MYLIKHLPPELQRRWAAQLALQHDVDIKRLWRRTPQAMDHAIGGPPINATIDWPYDASSSVSASSESEPGSSSVSESGSSSSSSGCPQCVTITISGMIGECSLLNRSYYCELNGECSDEDLTYSRSSNVEIDEENHPLEAMAWYDRVTERWSALVAVGPFSALFSSDFGVALSWEGILGHEVGCDGDAALTHSQATCPDESSSSSSSDASSSSTSSSISEGESGESSSSDGSISLECAHTICAIWHWIGGAWTYSSHYACASGPCDDAYCQSDNPPPPGPPPAPNNAAVRYCDNSLVYTQL